MSYDESDLAVFLEEAAEHVAAFEQTVLILENVGEDAELLNKAFRSAHTIKGSAAMLGFDALAKFTHTLEHTLDCLRGGKMACDETVVAALLGATDVLKNHLKSAGKDQSEPVAGQKESLDVLAGLLAQNGIGGHEAAPAAAPAHDEAASAPPADSAPPKPARARRSGRPPKPAGQPAPAKVIAPIAVDGGHPLMPTVGVRTVSLETAMQHLANKPSAAPATVAAASSARPTAPPTNGPRQGARPSMSTLGDGERESQATLRVPTEKVDRLVNLVGELVIAQAAVTQMANNLTPARMHLLLEAIGGLEQICREMQERILGVRMLPFKGVFDRLPRQVRDVSAAVGKRVRLEVHGEDTELDKSVIERIGDPLMHLVRNAIDHGIEKPETRVARGKPPEGTLKVSAYQRGGSVFVEVADDGAGLDRDKILAKARAQSLITSEATLSPAEVWALIFLPGFSTADKLTEVSGRGVGMDVVKRTIDELKGQVQIESTAGQGSRFRIQLPLTLAILDGLAVEVGGQAFIVPLTSVVESIRPSARQLRRLSSEAELIDARGEYQPLVRLHRQLSVVPRIEDPTRGIVVFVDDGSHRYGLLVDDVLGQFQVVLKSLEANYTKIQGLAGATVLGDGRVAMILDLHELATQADVDHLLRSWS